MGILVLWVEIINLFDINGKLYLYWRKYKTSVFKRYYLQTQKRFGTPLIASFPFPPSRAKTKKRKSFSFSSFFFFSLFNQFLPLAFLLYLSIYLQRVLKESVYCLLLFCVCQKNLKNGGKHSSGCRVPEGNRESSSRTSCPHFQQELRSYNAPFGVKFLSLLLCS